MYNQIEYTQRANAFDHLTSYTTKLDIKESNYLACTIVLPHLTDQHNQLKELKDIIASLSFPFIGGIEYSKQKANGWHFHFACSHDYINEVLSLNCHIATNYKGLTYWLGYIAKECTEKSLFKFKKEKYAVNNEQPKAPAKAIKEKYAVNNEQPKAQPKRKKKNSQLIQAILFFKIFISKMNKRLTPPIRPAPTNYLE